MKLQFGELLRKTRLIAGLTQEEMAEKLHMSRPNISKLERDEVELKASDLMRWAYATDMPQVFSTCLFQLDPSQWSQYLDQIMNMVQVVGAIIFPLIGGDIYVGQNQ